MSVKKYNSITPNDGSYLGSKKGKALREKRNTKKFNQAWLAQKDLLKDSLIKLYKDKNSIGLQWNSLIDWDDEILSVPRRIKRALNALNKGKFPLTAESVNRAVQIAQEIDLKIKASSFSWQDYPQWLPKTLKPQNIPSEKPKKISELIQEYEQNYWLSRDKEEYKDHRNWKNGYLLYLKKIDDWSKYPSEELFNQACRNYPKSKKRNECCSRIKDFAHFCGLSDYDNKQFRLKKSQIEIKAKPKREMTDKEIECWYEKFPEWTGIDASESHWELWQWMYAMQATYGFRNHEVLNIYNLDCEYKGDDGKLYFPFTDATKNPRGIIYTEGKGVKRAAFLPQPLRWIEQFKLRDIPKRYYVFIQEISQLSKYDREKAKTYKLHTYSKFLNEHGFTFTAYNLRHHYNVKNHNLGIPVSLIAKNLGHTIIQNTSTYLESQGVKSCLDALDEWQKKAMNTTNQDMSLEQQINLLRQENEQLKAVIQNLLESIKTENTR